jgi:hypothetical protein
VVPPWWMGCDAPTCCLSILHLGRGFCVRDPWALGRYFGLASISAIVAPFATVVDMLAVATTCHDCNAASNLGVYWRAINAEGPGFPLAWYGACTYVMICVRDNPIALGSVSVTAAVGIDHGTVRRDSRRLRFAVSFAFCGFVCAV